MGDEKKIDRWEHYEGSLAGPNGDAIGTLVSAEEDTDGDGRPDRWETYEKGELVSVSFDEQHTGHPTRRLVYRNGTVVSIESNPDGKGTFRTRTPVK
jgi:hypothetical protein